MNGLDILLYTTFTVSILCIGWILLNLVWIWSINLYHRISDELRWRR